MQLHHCPTAPLSDGTSPDAWTNALRWVQNARRTLLRLLPDLWKACQGILRVLVQIDEPGPSQSMSRELARMKTQADEHNAILKAIVTKFKNRRSKSPSPRPSLRASAAVLHLDDPAEL